MMTYEGYKKELKKQKESTKYFTKKFLADFTEYMEKSVKPGKLENTDLRKKVFESDFYTKNSCAWCVFLEIYNQENAKKYRVNVYKNADVVNSFTISAYSEDDARRQAELTWKTPEYTVDVK